jgi:hypothetical protein
MDDSMEKVAKSCGRELREWRERECAAVVTVDVDESLT